MKGAAGLRRTAFFSTLATLNAPPWIAWAVPAGALLGLLGAWLAVQRYLGQFRLPDPAAGKA